jgi:hypothetical protein
VRVGVQSDREGGVPEALGDDLRVDAGLQRQRRVRMPQVMQADLRQQRLLDRLAPVARDRLGVEGGAVLGREDEAGLDPALYDAAYDVPSSRPKRVRVRAAIDQLRNDEDQR